MLNGVISIDKGEESNFAVGTWGSKSIFAISTVGGSIEMCKPIIGGQKALSAKLSCGVVGENTKLDKTCRCSRLVIHVF